MLYSRGAISFGSFGKQIKRRAIPTFGDGRCGMNDIKMRRGCWTNVGLIPIKIVTMERTVTFWTLNFDTFDCCGFAVKLTKIDKS